jgi:8-oxo-dGTP pyrophosphatase MutT (NUDIX family)
MKPSTSSPAEQGALPYRACVGIMLINRAGLVLIGRRLPKWAVGASGCVWQMPQGGISASEPPVVAARRELAEETSVTSVEVIGEIPGWLTYDLPSELIGVALKPLPRPAGTVRDAPTGDIARSTSAPSQPQGQFNATLGAHRELGPIVP